MSERAGVRLDGSPTPGAPLDGHPTPGAPLDGHRVPGGPVDGDRDPVGCGPVTVPVRELVGLALRRNPRRAHLLVSVVLGKHVPADPRLVRGAGLTLGLAVARRVAGGVDEAVLAEVVAALRSAVAEEGGGGGSAVWVRDLALAAADRSRAADAADPAADAAAWVLGFGETATGLGQAVAEVLGAPGVSSTRRPARTPVAVAFTEAHSHASEHAVVAPAGLLRRPGTGVLVDDELSTGATALAAIRALHALRPRRAYVLATLVDVAGEADRARLVAGVAELGAHLRLVSLARGTVDLPPDLPARAAALAAAAAADPAAGTATTRRLDGGGDDGVAGGAGAGVARATGAGGDADRGADAAPGDGAVVRVPVSWPTRLPDTARNGLPAGLQARVAAAAARVAADVAAELTRRGVAGPVLVLGTEEHLDVPLRIAEALADRATPPAGAPGARWEVRSSSTTRSPVAAVDAPGYAVRSSLAFRSHDDPADGPGPRFAHNVATPPRPWSAVVVVVEREADTAALEDPGGLLAAVRGVTPLVLVVVTGPTARVTAPQDPLRGPVFGSYDPADVGWLLTDLSTASLAPAPGDREARLQSGREHYAESLPVEYEPTAAYRRLYDDALAAGAARTALAVGLLAGLLLDRGEPAALVSLARAGTPVGVLLRRWFARGGLDVAHLAVSIVRGRGIDRTALEWVAGRYDPARCVFVDGWTGKGAIARELAAAVAATAAAGGSAFDPELAVLADPGSCTALHGTREDWLIPSSCLNSTVSGLISRTVLNDRLIGPGDHHGGVFHAELAPADRSRAFVDTVAACFGAVEAEVADRLPALVAADRTPTWAGWAAVAAVAERYGIDDLNLVKPGVGETTRVLLRRRPWQVLVRRRGDPDLAHVERLAAERDVPVRIEPDLPYACIGLIEPVGRS